MKNDNIKVAVGNVSIGVQLSPDTYVYQGHGIDVVDAGLFRLDTLGICLVESGIYTIHLNERKRSLRSGDLLVCHPNDFYTDVTFSKSFYGTIIFASMNVINHILDTEYLQRCLSVLKLKPVFTLENGVFRLFKSYSATIAAQRESGIFTHYPDTGVLILQAMLVDIFRRVIMPDRTIKEQDGRSRPEIIYQKFLNMLLSTSVKPHEMETYANELCVSAKYLSFVCRKQSGKTAPQIIHEHIMNDALKYLRGTTLTVKEIAFRLKFTNYAFFCKSVKKHFGKTPLELRKILS